MYRRMAPAAGAVDPRGLVGLTRERLEAAEEDQGDEGQVAPRVDDEDGHDGPVRSSRAS